MFLIIASLIIALLVHLYFAFRDELLLSETSNKTVAELVNEIASSIEESSSSDDNDDGSICCSNRERVLQALEGLLGILIEQKKNKIQEEQDDDDDDPLQFLDAVYLVFEMFETKVDDTIHILAFQILSYIARHDKVKQKVIEEADCYGLDLPVEIVRESLIKTQQNSKDYDEYLAAELQRQACLVFGAFADGDSAFGTLLVDEGALDAIFDATHWFRSHKGVNNWALWSIFTLCYDNISAKVHLLKLNGIDKVCSIMKRLPDSIEAQRHGIAILFDTLRDNPHHHNHSMAQLRQLALASGIHQIAYDAMCKFPQSAEIVMMGTQILGGTGYRGEIPQHAFLPKNHDHDHNDRIVMQKGGTTSSL